MSSRQFRWGIIGTGKIAHDFVTALSYLPDAEVVAVGSRTQQSADKFSSEHGIARAYASHEAVADDPQVDIVYISTFHPFHVQGARACLSKGKAVVVEKPLTLNATEATELIELARSNKVFLMEAMWTRYYPASYKIRELIKSTLGDIKGVQVSFGFVDPGVPRLTQPELGGGALLDIGVYPLAFISNVFGGVAPSRVSAIGDLNALGTDDNVAINLAYGAGHLAQAYVSLHAQLANEALVYGTNGSIRIAAPFWTPTKFTLHLNDQPPQTFELPLPELKPGDKFNFINSVGLHYEAAYAQRALAEGRTESDVLSLDESLIIMRTMDEIRRQLGVVYPGEK
eukprot:TRINITY_DN6934_c0_g1_i1.p1 TRINITY_DN6934_c0_g1~~TRINITY_DN6934_c0_g1_i1.p1  ORF type:complete len:341 (+),score=128.00 TRINITY_DN6934_c0_g1_i1:168-1190(+)